MQLGFSVEAEAAVALSVLDTDREIMSLHS